MFILPDFPHNTRWLTPEERALAISRLEDDGHDKVDGFGGRTTVQGLRDAASDWKVWWFGVALLVQFIGQSFFNYFPTLTATMGYNVTITLLLTAPPWVFALIAVFALSRSVVHLYQRILSYGPSGTLTRSKGVTDTFSLPMHSLSLDSLYL